MITGLLILPLLITTVYFLVVTPIRLFYYWLAIVFHIVTLIGSVFKILHLPGADELLMTGFISTILTAGLIFLGGIKSTLNDSKVIKMLLSLCLILQLILSTLQVIEGPYYLLKIAMYLAFPILLLSVWLLFKRQTIHKAERNLIAVILAHAVFVVATLFGNPYSSFLL